ncbi:hypothetical protein HBN50_09600 [Halobacteriovorax sp. GB3]|uniref:hypothetical protein n=1 Tax=Halobacteriovorax sp. GB3 TaxID=2719615 RepID=UPI00235DC5F1|nr:hypothetical protein [Halobacteriovorax sp. GB3]MDD0853352.1 hypothetical protein [Halobacteriovorax sp. GB3]
MKNLSIRFIFIFIICAFSISEAKEFGINSLRFTNRAQCALDSKNPTRSAFVIVNNIDPGKAIYRLAKVTGRPVGETTKRGIELFRYSVVNLIQMIHEKMMNRDLPLLVSNTTKIEGHIPDDYLKYSRTCSNEDECDELNDYIKELWDNSERDVSSVQKVLDNYKLDNFHSKDNYMRKKDFDKSGQKLYCHYLKKFSPLQSHLFGTKPTRKAYEQFAVALDNIDQHLGDCYDFNSQENLKVAAYQFDLTGLDEKDWQSKGFDYWYSMKVYFSWAFRHAEIMKSLSNEYYNIFKGLDIENLVMIISNGCESITSPTCGGELLSKGIMREFAKADFKKASLDMDVFDGVPDGPQDDILVDPFTDVNTNIMEISTRDAATKWGENLATNLSSSRNQIKNNLLKAVNFVNILSRHFPLQSFETVFQKQFQKILDEENSREGELKNELYFLCSEYYFLSHETFSSVSGDLEILRKTNVLNDVLFNASKKNVSELFSYFDLFSKEVVRLCSGLRQKEIFDDQFVLEREGYQQWYLEKVFTKNNVESKYDAIQLSKLTPNLKPLLSYSLFSEKPNFDNIVCIDASHCARRLARSIVDIYRAATYARGLWAKKGEVSSNEAFNPYAERVACKVYDPWFKTKSMIFHLVSDIGQAAATLVTPGLIYGRVDLKPGRVVSFKQLVKEGKIEYEPSMDPERISLGLHADFGPLLGIPCKISVSNTANNPYDSLRFVGVSASTCHSKEEHTVIAYSGSDVRRTPVNDYSACAGCRLDFEAVALSVTRMSHYVGPVYFLVRAFVRLYKALKDPHNIPRDWIADPSDVYDTYKKYGYIPARCVKKFKKGKSCR